MSKHVEYGESAATIGAAICVKSVQRTGEQGTSAVRCLSFGPFQKILCFCDISVREKDWRAVNQAFERMRNTLSHNNIMVKT